jgi:hypothetical protein
VTIATVWRWLELLERERQGPLDQWQPIVAAHAARGVDQKDEVGRALLLVGGRRPGLDPHPQHHRVALEQPGPRRQRDAERMVEVSGGRGVWRNRAARGGDALRQSAGWVRAAVSR